MVHNDTTTCQLLSVLNNKREVNMYVVSDNSKEGLGSSSSYSNIAKARHEEGIHGEKAS